MLLHVALAFFLIVSASVADAMPNLPPKRIVKRGLSQLLMPFSSNVRSKKMVSASTTSEDEPVEIVGYQIQWPSMFEKERELLDQALAQWLAGPIEHIGSTAVPGLSAKPIIDIMAPVHSLEHSMPALKAASAIGYLHYPYKAEVMHWFCKPSPARRTHHLHLVPYRSALWEQRISFRQALRASPALAQEYAALKFKLASDAPHDREAYTNAKAPFIDRVLSSIATPQSS